MEKSNENSLFNIMKIKYDDIPFYISNSLLSLNHPILGYLTIPLTGKYSKKGYSLDKIKGLINLNCDFDGKKIIFSYNLQNSIIIALPDQIIKILNTIPLKIPHNKGKSKAQYIPNFNDYEFNSPKKIQFIWSISFSENIENKSNSNKKDSNYNKNDDNYKNIINHTWVFENLDFSKKKKLIENIPTCIIPGDKSGINQYFPENISINFNNLRSEYMSVHLRGEGICFSPDNLRFSIEKNRILSHFWTVSLKKNQNHIVCYHWLFNDLQEIFQELIERSKNIKELLYEISNILGNDNEAILQIYKLLF